MKVTTEDLGERQVLMTIEVDDKRVETALRTTARRLARQLNIPGFRRGRAPYRVILQRFGREALLSEALDDLGQDVIQDAVEGEDLDLYAPGSLEDMQLDPLVLKVRLPLRPAVDLGDYRALRVEPPVVTVDEGQVDAELERLRQTNVVLEPGGDRPAQMGDRVTLDVRADVGDASYVDQEAHDLDLEPDQESFAPGFIEQIVGLEAGQEKDFTLTLSDDEQLDEAFRGQEAAFSVKLHEVRARILPDLDDDLARTVGDFDSLEELREDIHGQFEEDEQRQADQTYTDQVLDALVGEATIEYPPDMIEDQIDSNLEDLERRLEGQGMALDDFFKLTGQTREAYRESTRPQVERSVRRGLALGELARLEELDVEGDEITQRIALLSAPWGERADEVREMLSSSDGVRSITNDLLADKAVQRIIAIAKGEAPWLEEADQDETQAPSEDEVASDETPEPVAEVEGAAQEKDTEPKMEQAEA